MIIDVLLLFSKELFFLLRKINGRGKCYQNNMNIFGYFCLAINRLNYERKLRLYYFRKSMEIIFYI